MKKILFVALLAVVAIAAEAQETKPTYVLEPGETIRGKLGFTDIYKYPSFGQGTVFFKNGAVTPAPLNYNYFVGAIQFIDPKGDTLTLGNEDQIALVTIANDSFYYQKLYLQLAERLPDGCSIYRKEFIRTASVKKMGLYDQTMEGGAVENYASFSADMSGAENKILALRQRVTLVRESFLYISDKYEHLVLVSTRRNFEKIFSKDRQAISTYLADHKVNFQNLEDVHGLLSFLGKHS